MQKPTRHDTYIFLLPVSRKSVLQYIAEEIPAAGEILEVYSSSLFLEGQIGFSCFFPLLYYGQVITIIFDRLQMVENWIWNQKQVHQDTPLPTISKITPQYSIDHKIVNIGSQKAKSADSERCTSPNPGRVKCI